MRISFILCLLGFTARTFAQYETQPSGYGSNNAGAVQKIAKQSPLNKPMDYTKTSNDALGNQKESRSGNQSKTKITGSRSKTQNVKSKGQSSVEVEDVQRNVGYNQNSAKVGQINTQQVDVERQPFYGDLGYGAFGGAIIIPIISPYVRAYSSDVTKKTVEAPTLRQINQNYHRQHETETSVAPITNTVNDNQTNVQGDAGTRYRPSYKAPNYGDEPMYIPDLSIFLRDLYSHKVDQAINPAQTNIQRGEDQAKVGINANKENGASQVFGDRPNYDSPRYSSGFQFTTGKSTTHSLTDGINRQQALGRTNQQGQKNIQKNDYQTSVLGDASTLNIGQGNIHSFDRRGSDRNKGYDVPKPYAVKESESPYRHR